MLQEGVKIIASTELLSNLEISEGLETATECSTAGIPYMSNAFKPQNKWRRLTIDELKLLKASDGNTDDYSSTIYIFDIPNILQEYIKPLALESIVSKKHFKKVQTERNNIYDDYSGLLKEYCEGFLINGKKISKTFYSVNDPNLSTTTKYFKGLQYTGLHIDNNDQMNIDNARHAQNRLCINLGMQTRYFLFVNQTVATMKKWILEKKSNFNPNNTQWHLGQLFFKTYGKYPIVRVPLRRFQAYIAPTENILHDGSSVGTTAPDIIYTLLGHFAI